MRTKPNVRGIVAAGAKVEICSPRRKKNGHDRVKTTKPKQNPVTLSLPCSTFLNTYHIME